MDGLDGVSLGNCLLEIESFFFFPFLFDFERIKVVSWLGLPLILDDFGRV